MYTMMLIFVMRVFWSNLSLESKQNFFFFEKKNPIFDMYGT